MTRQKYNLVGIDGNAYSIMGYVIDAMKEEGFSKAERDEYLRDAMSSDYNHLLCVSIDYVEQCNERAGRFSDDEEFFFDDEE